MVIHACNRCKTCKKRRKCETFITYGSKGKSFGTSYPKTCDPRRLAAFGEGLEDLVRAVEEVEKMEGKGSSGEVSKGLKSGGEGLNFKGVKSGGEGLNF